MSNKKEKKNVKRNSYNKEVDELKGNSSHIGGFKITFSIISMFLFFSGTVNFAQSLIDGENPIPHFVLAVISLVVSTIILGKERMNKIFLFLLKSKFGIIFSVGFVLWISMLLPLPFISSGLMAFICVVIGFILWLILNAIIYKKG